MDYVCVAKTITLITISAPNCVCIEAKINCPVCFEMSGINNRGGSVGNCNVFCTTIRMIEDLYLFISGNRINGCSIGELMIGYPHIVPGTKVIRDILDYCFRNNLDLFGLDWSSGGLKNNIIDGDLLFSFNHSSVSICDPECLRNLYYLVDCFNSIR